MYPCSCRIRASSVLNFECGMSTYSKSASSPLRMRVRKSATGSVIDIAASTSSTWSVRERSPRAPPRAGRSGRGRTCGSRHAGDRTACSGCSCASCTWSRAAGAPPGKSLPLALLRSVVARLAAFGGLALLALGGLGPGVSIRVLFLELLERGLLGLGALASLLLAALLLRGLLGGEVLARPALVRERHSQRLEQGERLGVGLRGGGDRHVETAHLVDRVVVDLREDDLLAHAHRVVATAVEGARVESTEVTDTRD